MKNTDYLQIGLALNHIHEVIKDEATQKRVKPWTDKIQEIVLADKLEEDKKGHTTKDMP